MDMPPQPTIQLFGPTHLLIMAMIPAMALLLVLAARSKPKLALWIRIGLGSFLVLDEVAWYIYEFLTSGLQFPDALPLHLCDITVWVAAVACLTLSPWSFEISYFIGIAGISMAVLTPDVWTPLLSYTTIHFFLMHGGAVMSILFLTWANLARPRPGGMWRVFLYLNLYAALMGTIDIIFKVNFMYLCRKPEAASIMDYLGPWPVYILGAEALAIGLFALLWLPVRKQSIAIARHSPAATP
jgi:hypothetical integral membrane protein (TIGR02206 family)